ncbi:MAG: hypothetical protein AAGK14_14915 [Verrucomicrobiota bacterium]
MKKLSNSILQMTLNTGILALGLALSALPLGAQTADHTGDFVIEADTVGSEGPGDLTMEGDQLDLGTDSSGPTLGMQFVYDDASDSFLFRAYQPQAVFEWWDGLTDNPNDVLKMRLGSDSTLSLFSPAYTGTGSDGMIELKPVVNGGSSIEIDGMKVVVEGGGYAPADLFGDSIVVGAGAADNAHTGVLVFGEGAQAAADGQIVLGNYNEPNAGDILQVGNGTSGSPSNAMSVDQDGDLTVGRDLVVARNTQLVGDLTMGGDINARAVYIQPTAGLSMGTFTEGLVLAPETAAIISDYRDRLGALGGGITDAEADNLASFLQVLLSQVNASDVSYVASYRPTHNMTTGNTLLAVMGTDATLDNGTLLSANGVGNGTTTGMEGLKALTSPEIGNDPDQGTMMIVMTRPEGPAGGRFDMRSSYHNGGFDGANGVGMFFGGNDWAAFDAQEWQGRFSGSVATIFPLDDTFYTCLFTFGAERKFYRDAAMLYSSSLAAFYHPRDYTHIFRDRDMTGYEVTFAMFLKVELSAEQVTAIDAAYWQYLGTGLAQE